MRKFHVYLFSVVTIFVLVLTIPMIGPTFSWKTRQAAAETKYLPDSLLRLDTPFESYIRIKSVKAAETSDKVSLGGDFIVIPPEGMRVLSVDNPWNGGACTRGAGRPGAGYFTVIWQDYAGNTSAPVDICLSQNIRGNTEAYTWFTFYDFRIQANAP